ncbi:MAG TPA: carboxypeptidase M32 [Fibrobacteria bacterium]|nr:carboxypeptidase M32 [Fibrobacteria bacterium]
MQFERMSAYDRLIAYLKETDHLGAASRLLQWDQETGMPPKGETVRAEMQATFARLLHEKTVSPVLSDLLEASRQEATDSDRSRQLELVGRSVERSRKVPASLVEELASATSLGQQVWARARKTSDFETFLPHLERVVELRRQEGSCIAPEGGTPYDGLLSDYERGLRTDDWTKLFAQLEAELPALAAEAIERGASRQEGLGRLDAFRGPFPAELQMDLCRKLAAAIGYDFEGGRLDLSAHPFSETVHLGDSRITTRVSSDDLGGAVFSTLHETGHALYEQGLPEALVGTPLGSFASMAVHESQSRLWENIVGRSDGFWQDQWNVVSGVFPKLGVVGPERWAERSRWVRRTLVRTESDEVTYNLHVLVRFRLEKAMIQGDLAARDLPGEWNRAYRDLLGVEPANHAEGCMQDVHWSAGMFGYFPTYTLGNLLSAQLHSAAQSQGRTSSRADLLAWLRENIHVHGSRWETPELIRRATGKEPSASDFLAYLRGRYLGG